MVAIVVRIVRVEILQRGVVLVMIVRASALDTPLHFLTVAPTLIPRQHGTAGHLAAEGSGFPWAAWIPKI